MNKGASWISGIGIGLALMFVLDPEKGRTRRALARNKLLHGVALADRAAGITARDASHRLEGLLARIRSPRGAVPDDILALRIRSRVGRYVSHPHAIAIETQGGRVILSGPVLEAEVPGLLRCARGTPGVVDVENRLEVHRWAEDVPALQGGSPRRGLRPDVLQDRWAPTTRLGVGLTGGILVARGAMAGGLLGVARASLGTALVTRSISNRPLARTLGLGVGHRLVDFQKTFEIDAPIADVWRFWSEAEDFPRVMAHIKDVRKNGDRGYHWVVSGPLGLDFEFDTQLVREESERVLEWEGLPGSEVGAVGSIRLDATPSGGTRVDIKLSYHPPLGLLGHAIAWMSGVDPHHALNEDMVRVKSFLEDGKTTVRGREITREELAALHAGLEGEPRPE